MDAALGFAGSTGKAPSTYGGAPVEQPIASAATVQTPILNQQRVRPTVRA